MTAGTASPPLSLSERASEKASVKAGREPGTGPGDGRRSWRPETREPTPASRRENFHPAPGQNYLFRNCQRTHVVPVFNRPLLAVEKTDWLQSAGSFPQKP